MTPSYNSHTARARRRGFVDTVDVDDDDSVNDVSDGNAAGADDVSAGAGVSDGCMRLTAS